VEPPAPVPPPVPTCQRRDVIVSGQGGERTASAAYLAVTQGCDAPRDTVALAVIDRILFTGLPGSPELAAIIPDSEQTRVRSARALDALFGGQGLQFVTGVQSSESGYLVTVSLDGLRRWLERNGVIRRFGLP
jgi:hypothetical protein